MVKEAEELDDTSRAVVGAYWWRRAEGELTSWVAFRHVLDDLRAEGSPEAVVALAERAVEDEYQHTLWCRDWAERFGFEPTTPLAPRAERPVTFPGASDADNRLLRIALCCFTETVGCFTLRRARPHLRDPELRKLNRRHMADELRHSRVGWGHLASLDARRRETLSGWLSTLLAVLPSACCEGPAAPRDDLVAFGYFTPQLLRAAHDEAVREVILPGLKHLRIARAQ